MLLKTIGFLLISSVAAAADPIYTVADLNGFNGPATGYAINSSGAVAGSSQNSAGTQQAFVTTRNGVNTLSSPTSDAYAYGVNNAGTVVGTTYANGVAHGTIWSASGATDLGANSYAMAVNNLGEVVGGNGDAFTVTNGQLQNLGNPTGVQWSAAYGLNDAGTAVGDGQMASGAFRGIIWSPNGSMVLLGTLGGTSSQATGINDGGEVVGFASMASGYQHAFSMLDALMIDLGTLGGGSSYAYGVNNSGDVVGYSWLANGDQHAFLYDNGTMYDLNSLIPSNSGWELLAAYGINDSGQITGEGLYNGQLSAFILTDPPAGIAPVPEPGGLIVVASGLTLFAIWRTRRGFPSGRRNTT